MKDTPISSDRDPGKEFPALIASMPVSTEHRRIALGVVIVLSAVFAFILPFARMPGGRLDSFIPVIQTVLCFADLITAVFLFAQYSIQPQRALLALASGYICSGLFAFLQTLDFPGSYTASGLISGRPSGAAWFFSLWHIAFPLAVIAYALMKDRGETAKLPLDVDPRRTIAITIACVLALTAALTWAVANEYLPAMFFDLTRQTPFAQYLAGGMGLLTVVAIVLLIVRMWTILDLWVTVTLIVSLPDLALSFMFKTSPHHRTMIDLNGIARQVLGMLEHDLHENGVSVSIELQEDLPQIMADRVQLQQIVLNLIKNAIDAMRAAPTSTKQLGVMTANGENSVSLFVQDSGPGIGPGDEARVFDPFFTTKSSGTGLGLSICRMIAEAPGGELRLAKRSSTGCTFEIALPV